MNFKIEAEADRFTQLSERIRFVRHQILKPIQQRYSGAYNPLSRTIDRVFQISAKVREEIKTDPDEEHQTQYEKDLAALKEVAHMVSWQPQYIEDCDDPSSDRLAEMVLKLEREVYGISRPQPLGRRDVFVQVGPPVDLGPFVAEYQEDAHQVRRKLTEQLRDVIQKMVTDIATREHR